MSYPFRKMNNRIVLGKEINTDENAALEIKELAKHFGCFGTIGSGKTVTCKVMIEELAMQGIPGIIIDPKGDLSSLYKKLIAISQKKTRRASI